MEWSNAHQLTWCRVLDEEGDGANHTFVYGADGIRCRKNNVHYTLDGSRILQEYHEDTGETLTFYYGEKGVFGFRYRDANGAENSYLSEDFSILPHENTMLKQHTMPLNNMCLIHYLNLYGRTQ